MVSNSWSTSSLYFVFTDKYRHLQDENAVTKFQSFWIRSSEVKFSLASTPHFFVYLFIDPDTISIKDSIQQRVLYERSEFLYSYPVIAFFSRTKDRDPIVVKQNQSDVPLTCKL